MSSYYSNKNYGGNNASLRKDEKIMCSVDEQWERSDQFSNNERRKYLDARRMGKPYNIRCRKHNQAPPPELTCSNCDERKPHEDFSNSQRKADPDVRRCRLCVNYTETVELLAHMPVHADYATPDVYKFRDDDSGQFPDDEFEAATTGAGAASAQDDASSKAPWSRTHNVNTTSDIINTHNLMVPPHAREGGDASYGLSSAPSDTGSIASTDSRVAHQSKPTKTYTHTKPYTAYGPVGQVQQRALSGVTASETASVATATTATPIPTTRSGWAKVSSRKVAVEAPDVLTRGKVDEKVEPKRYDFSSDGSEDEC